MSAAFQVVQCLARALEASNTSKTELRKVLLEHIRRLAPLRPVDHADLEMFYTVAAWYLTPPYLKKQQSVAGDLDVIRTSRRIKAVTTIHEAWGMKAVETLRKHLREPLPLPNLPGRDFLEALAKIATKRYALTAFLKDFPAFIQSRLGSWRADDAKYFKKEMRPCLQFRHVDAFYKDWYTPNFLKHGRAMDESISAVKQPAKRRKTSANMLQTRLSARTATRDNTVELSRRTHVVKRVEETSVVQEPSPTPAPSSSQQLTVTAQGRRHSTAFTGSYDNSIAYQELEQRPSHDDDPTTIESSDCAATALDESTMLQPRGPPQDQTQATRDVQDMCNSLQNNSVKSLIQWIITMVKRREELSAARGAAYGAWHAAHSGVNELKELISRKVPSGRSLDEATRDAQNDVNKTAETINQLMYVQKLLRNIQPDVESVGLQNSVNVSSSMLNQTSAEAMKKEKENKLKELEILRDNLKQREESLKEKKAAATQLDSEFAKFVTILKQVTVFLDLLQDDATCAAMAKLPNPVMEQDD